MSQLGLHQQAIVIALEDSLDAQSCGMLKDRAKFKPAIGLDGKPAKGSFVQRVTWLVSR